MVTEHGDVVLSSEGVKQRALEQIGRRLARALRPGDLVLLYGPLGAGKTTLVRAVAAELGVADPVRSPSFTIANIYQGRVTVQHLDLYRLEEIGDDDALALEEYVRPDAITFVEWPEAGLGRLGRADLDSPSRPRVAARAHAPHRSPDRRRPRALAGGGLIWRCRWFLRSMGRRGCAAPRC